MVITSNSIVTVLLLKKCRHGFCPFGLLSHRKLSAQFRKEAHFKSPREFNISMFLGSIINVKMQTNGNYMKASLIHSKVWKSRADFDFLMLKCYGRLRKPVRRNIIFLWKAN